MFAQVAIQGCCHGELDSIYASIAQTEQRNGVKVDLLIVCGDFQAVRNQGLELVKPSDEQRAEWKRYADKATDELVEEGELSRDMLDRLHRILEAHRDTAE